MEAFDGARSWPTPPALPPSGPPAAGSHHTLPAPGRPTRSGGTSPAWQRYSMCRSEDPELFFPVGEAGPALGQTEEAKAVCRRCPVIRPCRTWALDHHEEAGVWGGLSEQERRTIRVRAAREALRRVAPGPAAVDQDTRPTARTLSR